MKQRILAGLLVIFAISSCRKIEIDGPDGSSGGNTNNPNNNILSGRISSDLTLKATNVYKLRGVVYLVDGATLTIEPGTRIEGEKTTRGALIVTRGARIIANGTREKPIVFTSNASTPAAGDWGGIVLLGRATTNSSFNNVPGIGEIEGGINNGEGLGLYGGADDNDNSGSLKYIRIEYAGYAFLPDKELNSLTLGGVGRGTVIDYVQISYALDDAFEFFGGTVNASHLISYKTLDDDFDTDNGYRGNVQFGIVIRDSTIADKSKVEAFESDNDPNGSSLSPQTSAVFSNITAIGPRAGTNNTGSANFLAGAQIRRNSGISIFNSVIAGWPIGILIDASKGEPADKNIKAGVLNIRNTVIAGSQKPLEYAMSPTSTTGWNRDSVTSWFLTPAFGNNIYNTNEEINLTAAFNYSSPDIIPQSASPLLTGASFTNSKLTDAFFKKTVNFRGAAGAAGTEDGDWWKGWSVFR
jgi:hypothetical protein